MNRTKLVLLLCVAWMCGCGELPPDSDVTAPTDTATVDASGDAQVTDAPIVQPRDAGHEAQVDHDSGPACMYSGSASIVCYGTCIDTNEAFTHNCGSCGNDCMGPHVVAGGCAATSTGLTCLPIQCATGFADCDGNIANGCEAALDTLDNCGACGHSLTGEVDTRHYCGPGGVCYLARGTCQPR